MYLLDLFDLIQEMII